MGAEPQTRCAGDAGLGLGSPPALSPAPGPNTCPPAWRLGKQAVLGGAVVQNRGSPSWGVAVDTACPCCKGSCHVDGHSLLMGVGCCPGRHSGPFGSQSGFLTTVRRAASPVGEEPWHSAGPSGERPVSMAGAVCVHGDLHAPCVTRHVPYSAWLSAPAGTPAPCWLAPS